MVGPVQPRPETVTSTAIVGDKALGCWLTGNLACPPVSLAATARSIPFLGLLLITAGYRHSLASGFRSALAFFWPTDPQLRPHPVEMSPAELNVELLFDHRFHFTAG